jgi:hypothetical protein
VHSGEVKPLVLRPVTTQQHPAPVRSPLTIPLLGPTSPNSAPRFVYGVHTLDDCGRVVSATLLDALGWAPGDRVGWRASDGRITLRPFEDGAVRVGTRRFWLPAHARDLAGLTVGDQVLLAADTTHRVLMVFGRDKLDELARRLLIETGGDKPEVLSSALSQRHRQRRKRISRR